MKDKYNGYPQATVTNPVRHSDEYFMEQSYLNDFYSNKEFHVKRIQKGKNIRNLAIGEAAIETVIAGGLALGVILHGNNFLNSIRELMTVYNYDIYAIAISLGAFIPIAMETIEAYKRLSHIQTDLNVSKNMIKELEKEETKGREK